MIVAPLVFACMALAACGGGGSQGSGGAVGGPSSPAPSPSPSPTPTPTPTPDPNTIIPASVTTNFDVQSELVAAWGNGAIPASAAPDIVGAFRFICTPAHLAYDDPIVYPGQPGRSHLHQFFGNTAVNANSTFQSLRTTGESTCMSPLNRSGYWQPAMLTAQGKVVRPDYWQIYYKRRPSSDPACTIAAKGCVGIPRGMRFIFGYDMITNTPATGALTYLCVRDGRILVGVEANTIPAAAAQCAPGDELVVRIGAPECWDGKRIDSPNHRDHVAYEYYEAGTGRQRCPDSHPYLMPTFTLSAFYSVVAGDQAATWRLSSDEMLPGAPAGSTFHADFFSAWDDDVEQMWLDNCIDKLLNCSGGDLGNGKQLKLAAGFAWKAEPRLVDPPTKQ